MRFILPLLALAAPLHAELLATFHTTKGDVVAELQYDHTPQTVASFITLAEGTRNIVDPLTGAVTRRKFFDGQPFYRTANNDYYKFAQTGSGNGTNNGGGPGYTIRDELTTSLTHVPYVLSMAHAGPNTNGSQFFITGSLSQPSYDLVHTVFGLVTDTASQAVIDSIINAGDGASTINSVTISRTDASAAAFDEHAQNLPVVSRATGTLSVARNSLAQWVFDTPITEGTVFRAFRSETLEPDSWLEIDDAALHLGIDATAPDSCPLDDASAPHCYYHLTTAAHPGACAPDSLVSRTVELTLSGGTLTLDFDSTGIAGTTTYTPATGDPFGGPFTATAITTGPHHLLFIANTPSIAPQYLLIKIGCDLAGTTRILGRHSTQYYDFDYDGWYQFASGSSAISR
ncbi:MAG: peptidylprolyl isomerase [Verrucomicrobiales bacterium]|nr:peptidylprolyl isomerase [Verrucomicrobiota bacterium JB025]